MDRIKLLITFILITTLSFSQESFVIKNVYLFDGESVKENTYVLVENGIISIVSTKEITHKTVVDGKNKTLIPALTNSHVHVWSPLSLQEAAKAGVLNLLDMHAVESLIPTMKAYKTSTDYADYYAAGAAATVPNGHGTQFGFSTPTLTTPEEATKFVSDRINAGADYIKIIKEPWKVTLNDETVNALIKASHKQNKKAVVHISKVKDGYNVLKNKADGLVHIWNDEPLTDEQLSELKNETFFVIPTLLTIQKFFYKENEEEIKKIQKEVKRLYDIGVPILAGTDPPNANINYGTDLYKEMLLLKGAGLSNIDVLKSATSLPAIHFNLKNKGFIKVGYRADFILIDGNPLKNINEMSNSKRIWKQGKELKVKN